MNNNTHCLSDMEKNDQQQGGQGLSSQVCSADFVMAFGKYKGQTLDQISDNDPGYVVWLSEGNVLKIEREFLDAVRMDEMEAESEMRDIINEHVHDIY